MRVPRIDLLPASLASRVSASQPPRTPEERMVDYIQAIFTDIVNLQPGQPLRIEAPSEYLPFVRLMVEEAYKNFGSGRVSVKLIEPELEALKRKYDITSDFRYKELGIEELRRRGAAFVTFDETNSPYEGAGLTEEEVAQLIRGIVPEIPADIQELLSVDPREILEGNLSFRDGQPLRVSGSREHMPQILQIVEYAYEHGSTLVDVEIDEDRWGDLGIPFYMYAGDEVLVEVPPSYVARLQEYLDTGAAISLHLAANNSSPKALNSL